MKRRNAAKPARWVGDDQAAVVGGAHSQGCAAQPSDSDVFGLPKQAGMPDTTRLYTSYVRQYADKASNGATTP